MAKQRYVVDMRVGLVSVRDTASEDYSDGGCMCGDPAVVKKWKGKVLKQPRRKKTDNRHWYVPYFSKLAAQRLCEKLNSLPEEV
jgi:hypothetical protein